MSQISDNNKRMRRIRCFLFSNAADIFEFAAKLMR